LLVLAAPPAHLRSQRSPIPGVRPPTHLRGHWPLSWPDPAVHLVSTPAPRLLYHCDTTPSSSSSSVRTFLLVYHLFPLSPNVWREPGFLKRCFFIWPGSQASL